MSAPAAVSSDELRPCPFCGGEKVRENVKRTRLVCDACTAQGPYSTRPPGAVAAWNERAAAVTQGAGTEDVERLRDEAVKAFRAYGRQFDASHDRFAEHETERPDRCTVENAIRALALAARAAPGEKAR